MNAKMIECYEMWKYHACIQSDEVPNEVRVVVKEEEEGNTIINKDRKYDNDIVCIAYIYILV